MSTFNRARTRHIINDFNRARTRHIINDFTWIFWYLDINKYEWSEIDEFLLKYWERNSNDR